MKAGGVSLQQHLRDAAWRHRRRTAISTPQGTVSHLGLLCRAQVQAWRIRTHAEQLDGPVGLSLPKETALVAHLLGVILAGGAYVCVNRPGSSGGGLSGLRGLGARLFIHDRAATPSPDEIANAPGILSLKANAGRFWPAAQKYLPATHGHADRCALVRTSGSSGEPCGVWQESAAILHHAEWTITSQKIDECSRLSWLAAPGVAAAHSHLFAAMLSGACLCPFEPAKQGLGEMTRWMRAERITHLHLTPTLLRAWLDSLPDDSILPDLRSVKLGGESARAADARLLRRKLGSGPRLLNGLGMSEASGNIALCEITPQDETGDGLLPVGHPVPGRVVSLESAPGVAAAPGEVGEIVVRDEWVAPGYEPAGARDTIRTTENPAIRELRTGDAGRWDAVGRLVHLGRLDRRIRVRGKTVDLTELEARLANLAFVAHVAAVAEPDKSGYRVALVLKPDNDTARQVLAGFWAQFTGVQPARVACFAELPRKANGKRDDEALLANWPREEAVHAWRGCEIYIREAWARVLGHADFGPDDDFPKVGGDSLSAMNLAVELSRLAQRDVGMADIVRLPNVSVQARALETRKLGVPKETNRREKFHIEWVRIPAPQEQRVALVHPGGYTKEADVWIAGALLAGLGRDTTLLVAKANIEDRRITAPRDWEDMVAPLMKEALKTRRPLLIGVCLGAMLIADITARLTAVGRTDFDLILLDPWTPGLGRSAAGLADRAEHPRRIREYFSLFRNRDYPPMPTLRHVILAGDDSHFEARRNYWSGLVPSPAHLHVVRGDHMSFLREHRDETACKLAEIVRRGDLGAQGATS